MILTRKDLPANSSRTSQLRNKLIELKSDTEGSRCANKQLRSIAERAGESSDDCQFEENREGKRPTAQPRVKDFLEEALNLSFPRKQNSQTHLFVLLPGPLRSPSVQILAQHLLTCRRQHLNCSHSTSLNSSVSRDELRSTKQADSYLPAFRPSYFSLPWPLLTYQINLNSHHDTSLIFALACVGATPRPGFHHFLFHDRNRFSAQPRFGVLWRHHQWFSRHAHSCQGGDS